MGHKDSARLSAGQGRSQRGPVRLPGRHQKKHVQGQQRAAGEYRPPAEGQHHGQQKRRRNQIRAFSLQFAPPFCGRL